MKRQIPRWMRVLAAVLLVAWTIGRTVERRGQERRLLDAATAGDVATVSALLGQGIGPQARERKDDIEYFPQSGHYYSTRWQTPLHAAAYSGGGEVAARLIRAGASVNATTTSGHTPLMLAAGWQGVEVVRQLLAAGADPNRRELEKGDTALHIAAVRGNVAVLRALLDAGAEVNVVDLWGFTPLSNAVEKRHRQVVKLLLERGATVHVRGDLPPFYAAARNADLETARLLLAHGADPRERYNGNTPLQAALASSHWRMARFLRAAEADYAHRGAVREKVLPIKWRRPRISTANWDEAAERMALSVGLPLLFTYLDGWLLLRLWKADGLLWLKGIDTYLPLRGRWLRTLLTVVLLALALPLCAYNCVMLLFLYQWLVSLSYAR